MLLYLNNIWHRHAVALYLQNIPNLWLRFENLYLKKSCNIYIYIWMDCFCPWNNISFIHMVCKLRSQNQVTFRNFSRLKLFTSSLQGRKLVRQISQWEESETVLFMLELTWETDKTLLYGSAIPFMYNIWVNRSLHPWPTSSVAYCQGNYGSKNGCATAG